MQLILCGAAVVSLLVKEWSTAVLWYFLTVLNAVVGLRQEARRKRDERAQVDDEGDGPGATRRHRSRIRPKTRRGYVVCSRGRSSAADGRIIAASALQIDESALTGESVPAAKDANVVAGEHLGPAIRRTWRS